MASLFTRRTSTDSQRPQSRRSLKSRLSFSAQSRENISDALPVEEVPPVPPLPAKTKPEIANESPKDEREPEDPRPMADAATETPPSVPAETKVEAAQPVQPAAPTAPTPSKSLPPVPIPKNPKRHSRHDSAMAAPTPPKRSSSFRSVLNTYYKIFGGSPKKVPKHEKLPEQAERLQKLVKKYEAQLEEASEILLLQDKVIARWEKEGVAKGVPMQEVSSNGVTAAVPAQASVEKDVSAEASANGQLDAAPSESSRSLGLIRESSKEMLSEIAAQQAKSDEINGDSATLRLVDSDTDKNEELESTRRDLAAAQAAADGYAKRYRDLEKQAEESATALAEANVAKESLESDLGSLKAELDATRKAHEELSNRDAERATADASAFDQERSTLQSRIIELEKQLADSKATFDAQAQAHEDHKTSLARDLEEAHAARTSSTAEVGRFTASLDEAEKNHALAIADHDTTKALLAEQVALVTSHQALLAKKNEEHEYAVRHHENTIAEHSNELEAAASKLQTLTLQHDELNAKHSETVAALSEAEAKVSAMSIAQSEEHQSALDALAVEVNSAKAELKESKALVESMKKEHGDSAVASATQLEEQRTALEKLTSESKTHQDRVLALDEELLSAKTAHKSAEDAHVATRVELESLTTEKSDLLAKIVALTTASTGHETQVAELEKVNKEMAELKQELEGHSATKNELEAKIAALESEAGQHATTKADLDTSRAQIIDLESKAEEHVTAQADLQAKIAALEGDASKHDTSQTELQAKIAELESAAEGHASAKSGLEAQIAELQANAEKHAVTFSDLETSRARATELEAQVEHHATTKADLESAQAQIAGLKIISEAHEAQKTDLEDAKTKIDSLSKDLEAHQTVKGELYSAQNQIADLESSLETGKADRGAIAEKLAAVEASLATATSDHERLSTSLSEKEAALQKALSDIEDHDKQLAEKSTALASAQEALEKAQLEAARAATLTTDLKNAEDKVSSLEADLVLSNEKHEAEKASLSAKIKDIEKLREQNHLLQQQLDEALENEWQAKASASKLEAGLHTAQEKVTQVQAKNTEADDDHSRLEKAALAAGAVGAVGAGAFGVSKLLDDDDDEVDQSVEPTNAVPEDVLGVTDGEINDKKPTELLPQKETPVEDAPAPAEFLEEKKTSNVDEATPEIREPSVKALATAGREDDASELTDIDTAELTDIDTAQEAPQDVLKEYATLSGADKAAVAQPSADVDEPAKDDGSDDPSLGEQIQEQSISAGAEDSDKSSLDAAGVVDASVPFEAADSAETPQIAAPVEVTPVESFPEESEQASVELMHALAEDEDANESKSVQQLESNALETDEADAERDLGPDGDISTIESTETSSPAFVVPDQEPEQDKDTALSMEALEAAEPQKESSEQTVKSSDLPGPKSSEDGVEHNQQVEQVTGVEESSEPVAEPVSDAEPSEQDALPSEIASPSETTPQIQCLTCGDDMEMEKLADHFCTPASSPESDRSVEEVLEKTSTLTGATNVASSSDPISATEKNEPLTIEPTAGSDPDAGTEDADFVSPSSKGIASKSPSSGLPEPVSETPEAPEEPVAEGSLIPDTKLVPVEAVSTDDVNAQADDNNLAPSSPIPEVASSTTEASKADADDTSNRDDVSAAALAASTETFSHDASALVDDKKQSPKTPELPDDSIIAPVAASNTSPVPDTATKEFESDSADVGDEPQSSPPTPQTPSRKKSVRWEDIESSKQSTPVEELEKQLDHPVMNGDHDDVTADKHSIGPGSPVAEMHGLAIADMPLSEEPMLSVPEHVTIEAAKADSLDPKEERDVVSEDNMKNMNKSDLIPTEDGSAHGIDQDDAIIEAAELGPKKFLAGDEVIKETQAETPEQPEASLPGDGADKILDSSAPVNSSETLKKPTKEPIDREDHSAEPDKDLDVESAIQMLEKDGSEEGVSAPSVMEELQDVGGSGPAPILGQQLVEKTTDLVSTVKDKLVANKEKDEESK